MSNVNFDFKGKKVVVTGASSGMGRQVAVELAESGAIVLAIARRRAELEALRDKYNQNIFIFPSDITIKDNIEIAIKTFVEKFGKIDGVVHAAGSANVTPLRFFDEKIANEMMELNLWSGVNLVEIVNKKKYSNNDSSYVMFSSIYSYNGGRGMLAYSASKAALRIAVHSMAKEICERGARINTVSPGWVETEMTLKASPITNSEDIINKHLLGTGKPSDVSGVVLFLLSDRSQWVTGTDIIVDGGYLS